MTVKECFEWFLPLPFAVVEWYALHNNESFNLQANTFKTRTAKEGDISVSQENLHMEILFRMRDTGSYRS